MPGIKLTKLIWRAFSNIRAGRPETINLITDVRIIKSNQIFMI